MKSEAPLCPMDIGKFVRHTLSRIAIKDTGLVWVFYFPETVR